MITVTNQMKKTNEKMVKKFIDNLNAVAPQLGFEIKDHEFKTRYESRIDGEVGYSLSVTLIIPEDEDEQQDTNEDIDDDVDDTYDDEYDDDTYTFSGDYNLRDHSVNCIFYACNEVNAYHSYSNLPLSLTITDFFINYLHGFIENYADLVSDIIATQEKVDKLVKVDKLYLYYSEVVNKFYLCINNKYIYETVFSINNEFTPEALIIQDIFTGIKIKNSDTSIIDLFTDWDCANDVLYDLKKQILDKLITFERDANGLYLPTYTDINLFSGIVEVSSLTNLYLKPIALKLCTK